MTHMWWHATMFWMTSINQLLTKVYPIHEWLLEAVEATWEWGVFSCNLQKLHKQVVLSHSLRTLWKLCKNGACFRMVFGSCKGCRRAFSETTSTMKASCDPELLWVSHRCRLKEREHCLKVSDAEQILGITHDWTVFFFNEFINVFLLFSGRGLHASRIRHFLNFRHAAPKRFANTGLCHAWFYISYFVIPR